MLHTEETALLSPSELELRGRLTLLAKDFFLERGYTGSTMDMVAKTAKVSKKTVYKLFSTKEAVLQSVVQSIMREIEELTTPLFNDVDESFDARFERLIVQISPQYALLRSPASIKEMRIAAPETYEEFDAWRRSRFSLFIAMMTRARDSGALSAEFDFDGMISIYAALHNSCMDYSILKDADIPAEHVYRAFVDVFLNGILSRERVAPEHIV